MNRALLLAAGKSTRFGEDKLSSLIGAKTVFEQSLDFLSSSKKIDEIYIATSKINSAFVKKIAKKYSKVRRILVGGSSRLESVKKLIYTLPEARKGDLYIIHNAANPTATPQELALCISKCKKTIFGVAPAHAITATLKRADKNGHVKNTIDREDIYALETPQVVKAVEFSNALRTTKNHNFTDDLAVLEHAGYATCVIPASRNNKKITYPEDLLPLRGEQTGIGQDGHSFIKSSLKVHEIRLGGVTIPHTQKLDAQSDGDVVLHALANALSSALGGGSLGTFATALCKKGIRNSSAYVHKLMKTLMQKKKHIIHCSISIEAKTPAIDPYAHKMRISIGKLLHIDPASIGITATTNGGLSDAGKGKGISCISIIHIADL